LSASSFSDNPKRIFRFPTVRASRLLRKRKAHPLGISLCKRPFSWVFFLRAVSSFFFRSFRRGRLFPLLPGWNFFSPLTKVFFRTPFFLLQPCLASTLFFRGQGAFFHYLVTWFFFFFLSIRIYRFPIITSQRFCRLARQPLSKNFFLNLFLRDLRSPSYHCLGRFPERVDLFFASLFLLPVLIDVHISCFIPCRVFDNELL